MNSVYILSKNFPKDELFGLVNQMRRAAISIPSNIAEGCGRRTANDTIQFLHIARGSVYELETQLYLEFDQNYISDDEFKSVGMNILSCKKLLNGFINYYKTFQK